MHRSGRKPRNHSTSGIGTSEGGTARVSAPSTRACSQEWAFHEPSRIQRCSTAAEDFYAKLLNAGIEVLYDDRDESPGAKFATMDLIGVPDQIVIGPRGIAAGTVELKARRSGERVEASLDTALDRLTAR